MENWLNKAEIKEDWADDADVKKDLEESKKSNAVESPEERIARLKIIVRIFENEHPDVIGKTEQEIKVIEGIEIDEGTSFIAKVIRKKDEQELINEVIEKEDDGAKKIKSKFNEYIEAKKELAK